MIRAFPCLGSAALALALGACAATSDYPSLERRPAERITGSAEVVAAAPAPTPPPAPPAAELTARLAQLVEQARAADQRFGARRGNAERLIGAASGAAVGSESWSVASIALADLESARSDAMVALGALDEIYAAEAVAAADSGKTGNAEAARAAHEQVGALVAQEDAVLAGLRGKL
jgi:hypothetical protein